MSELKHCPFCGGESRITYNLDSFTGTGPEPYVFTYCCSCGIRSPKYFISYKEELNEAERAVTSLWNRRVNDG